MHCTKALAGFKPAIFRYGFATRDAISSRQFASTSRQPLIAATSGSATQERLHGISPPQNPIRTLQRTLQAKLN